MLCPGLGEAAFPHLPLASLSSPTPASLSLALAIGKPGCSPATQLTSQAT